jgi:thiamine phosphate synthase YjbQ (UPF0047 family)
MSSSGSDRAWDLRLEVGSDSIGMEKSKMVVTNEIHLQTKGRCEIVDITARVRKAVRGSGLEDGILTLFCPGSTGALSTVEYESGVLHDLEEVLDEIVPPDRDYRHHLRWG